MKQKRSRNKEKEKKESGFEILSRMVRNLLDQGVCIYMLLVLAIMPFYHEEGFSHIGTDKATFLREALVGFGRFLLPLAGVLLLLGKSGLKKAARALSLTDWFALVYGAAVLLSYLFTDYREEALWGTAGWYMGLIPQLTAVCSYFFISRLWKKRDWIVLCILPVSTIVFLLGFLNRFGIFPIDMVVENVSFVSTIGNINWYCGYLVSVFFVGYFLLWKGEWKVPQKAALMVYVAVGFATLATHGSSSGIVALAAVFLLIFYLSKDDGKRMEVFWQTVVLYFGVCSLILLFRRLEILHITYEAEVARLFTRSLFSLIMTGVSLVILLGVMAANRRGKYPQQLFSVLARTACITVVMVVIGYLVLVGVNTACDGIIYKITGLPENRMFTFSSHWGSSRGATYLAGLYCFREQDLLHKVVGAGPDCMSAFLYTHGSNELVSLVQSTFGTSRLTNTHNEWLTILVNNGMIGCAGFVGMMVTAIWRYIKVRDKNRIAAACGLCLFAYTVNNMFSFQQSMTLATVFVVLGIGENYLRGELG